MKYLLIILAIMALTHTTEAKWTKKTGDEIREIHRNCYRDHPVSEELMDKMRQFEYPNVVPVRQYLLCLATETGIFSEKDGFHANRMAAQFKLDLKIEDVRESAKNCVIRNELDTTSDRWVYSAVLCMMENIVGDRLKYHLQRRLEQPEYRGF